MRRFISVVLGMVLALSLCVPVLAEDGTDTAAEHEHVWSEWIVESEPDCTQAGEQVRICTIDGCNEEEHSNIPALGHDWGDWTVAASATVFTKGTEEQFCSRCGARNTRTTAKLKAFVSWKKKVAKLNVKAKSTFSVTMAEGDRVKKWISSKKKVATVSKSGVVTGKKKGTTTITAYTASGKKISCKVKVVKAAKKSKKKASGGTVYWTPSGKVYHYSRKCSTLARSKTVYSGSIAKSGKSRACKVCG